MPGKKITFLKNEQEDIWLNKCLNFLKSIGIQTKFEKIHGTSFLPGLTIDNGSISIDIEALFYPGDILHEAGHLAVIPAVERSNLTGDEIGKREHRAAEEMMAIAWSYAACIHLDIDPYFVFHDAGYKGGGNQIAESFKNKQYFGVPMLQWKGMTVDEKNATLLKVKPYPNMLKWVLE